MSAPDPLPLSAAPGAFHDQLLAAVAGQLEEAVLVVSADHRLRFANAVARRMLSLDDASIGRRMEEALPDYRLSLMVGSCLTSREEIVRELADTLRGSHLVARALLVGAGDGGTSAVALVIRDDSRLRRLETVRRDFVANVSHELRTPIAAIQLLVETLQEGALGDAEVAGEFVNKIGLEVAHMAQMVSELLELSTIEAGRPAAPAERVPISELLTAADRLRPLADERRITVRHVVAEPEPAVMGDATALGQVIRNLVHNGIKFTAEGGTIEIAVGVVDADPPMVQVTVADSGCGIPADELPRVFERFYKADKSRQRDGEGTGLGLAIARHTIQAHGGSIRVESEVGRGSIFIVRLPAAL